jgi:hypothetical protein
MNAETHIYTAELAQKGEVYHREIPGVTSLLGSAGISSPFIHDDFRADFGRKGHKIINLFLRDNLGEYDPFFEPWMIGIRRFKDECGPFDIMLLDNTIVYSERYGFCGMPDFLGLAKIAAMGRKKELYLLDWKFWNTATRGQVDDADIQTSAYAHAVLEMKIVKAMPKRAVVHFVPNEYHIEPLNDPAAWTTFLSALNIRHWKERHK